MQTDTRNISDRFKWWLTEDIRTDLRETRSDLIQVFVNVLGDFNLSSGIRNTNWFNAHSAIIAGRKKWDRRGAVGTHLYTQVDHFPDLTDAIAHLRSQGYRITAAEITSTAVPLPSYAWQPRTAVLYGEEGAGLAPEVLDLTDDIVYIPGRGSVRSLNIATTSGIFAYDYSVKMGLLTT